MLFLHCWNDCTIADEEKSGTVFRDIDRKCLALALVFLTRPCIDPAACRKVNLVCENSEAEAVSEHILVAHIVNVLVIREYQRHASDNRHSVQGRFYSHRVDVWYELVTHLDIVTIHSLFVLVVIERMHHAEPAVDLAPRQEESEMETLHLLLLRNAHHVTGSIEESAHTQIDLVK